METGLFFHLGANLTGTANSGQIAGKLQDHLKAKPDLKAVLGADFPSRTTTHGPSPTSRRSTP